MLWATVRTSHSLTKKAVPNIFQTESFFLAVSIPMQLYGYLDACSLVSMVGSQFELSFMLPSSSKLLSSSMSVCLLVYSSGSCENYIYSFKYFVIYVDSSCFFRLFNGASFSLWPLFPLEMNAELSFLEKDGWLRFLSEESSFTMELQFIVC